MYSTKTATTNNQEFTGSYMPVGINENRTLKEVNVNKPKTVEISQRLSLKTRTARPQA